MALLPVLKPARWDGPSAGAHAHLWIGTTTAPEVYVGYGWESSDGLIFATQSSNDASNDEIVRNAFTNLDRCEVGSELVEANDARMLVSMGHPFASEQVLSERLMLRIHETLGADRLVVSIAKRGSLLASPYVAPDEAKRTMVKLHVEAWLSAPSVDRITDRLVLFDQATKSDTMTVAGDGAVAGWDVRSAHEQPGRTT